jgi:choline kinase
MDADVLYDERLMGRLIASPRPSCLLLDRNCEAGEEPVKVCVSGERIVEFGKVIAPGIEYDFFGESVGFFKVSAPAAARLRARVEAFLRRGDRDSLYEAAVRELLLEEPDVEFGFEDVTGLPWTEVDFHADLERARREIVPLLIDHDASKRSDVA